MSVSAVKNNDPVQETRLEVITGYDDRIGYPYIAEHLPDTVTEIVCTYS